MEFEYDADKSAANGTKHGVSFTATQQLWRDPHRVEIQARTDGERRWLVVGLIVGKHRSAVVTYREERTRIISVRRTREEEVEIYEG